MKDLTHYFPSPTKPRQDPAAPMDNQNCTTTGDGIADEEEALLGKIDSESGKKTPRKKRSRVKIKISVNGSRTRRCDIIDNKDDVIDKTPSPFASGSNIRKAARRSVSDTECAIVFQKHANREEDSPREETANAFDVMMTRSKPARYKILQTPSPSEAELEVLKSKEYRITLEERKQRLIALADQKGYSKRKHAELEEAELIENKLKKRAKLFRREDDGGELVDREKTSVQTPRTKAKWTMKVKLQSHSDEGETEDGNGNLSDDDYIFTPKSKMKFDKDRSRQRSSAERKNQTGERRRERRKKDKVTLDCSDSKSGFVTSGARIPRHLGFEKQTENEAVNIPEEVKQSPVQESVRKTSEPDVKVTSMIWPEDIVADVNRTEIENTRVSEAMKKLAPLFIKKPKSSIVAKEARRSFLQSGIPDKVMKKTALEQKNCRSDVGYSFIPFPGVSHVGQTQSEPDLNESRENGFSTLYRHKLDPGRIAVSLDLSHFRSLSDLGKGEDDARKTDFEEFVKIDETNLEDTLRELESRYSDVRTMWANISSTSNRTPKKYQKKRNKKLKLHQGKGNSSEIPDSPNPTWTCKYKPTSSGQIVGNDAAIGKLRNWLSGWRLPSPNDDRSSGDEFFSSDSSSSGCYENNQVAVLLGPYGSGKTASVYAIAEELGYRVLEVNASSRRTGKKILTNFQEATKSHRVKRSRQNTLLPVKKKAAEKKVPQNSLILIEDVDVIFDEDEGFVSATFQLAANTRRPIVLTCREACPHLNKMAQRQLLIHFQEATGSGVSTLLELISLAESGCRLPKSCLKMLLRNGDLRQSLLQLQFILLSGPPSTSQFFRNEPVNLWQDARFLIYKPAVKRSKKYRKESTDEKYVVEEDAKEVNELAAKLDCILLVSSLTEVENPAPSPWKRKPNPSLSLVQDFQPYSNSENLSHDIADWLRRATLGTDQPTNFETENNLSVKRNVKLGIDLALSQAVSLTLEHRSKSTDYLPVIRTICRTEEERARVNTKRSKRFHNYLHGLNVASTSSNILAAASSVFKDKFP